MNTAGRPQWPHVLAACLVLSFTSNPMIAQPRQLDGFGTLGGWKTIVSDGATLALTAAEGQHGKAMVMAFDLSHGSGYVIAEKDFALDLPPDYQFTFDMRAEAPVNNFEFKVIDDRENVYWIKKLNIEYPKVWTKQRIKKRRLTFAWGPAPGRELRTVRKLQFVVSTGTGGTGRVLIDDFRFEPIDDTAGSHAVAEITAPGVVGRTAPSIDSSGSLLTDWHAADRTGDSLVIDFHRRKEIGGLVIDWDSTEFARAYDVLLSDDGIEWSSAYSVQRGKRGRSYVCLQDAEANHLKLKFNAPGGNSGVGIRRMEIRGPEFSASLNDFFRDVAADAPPGTYPRYLQGKQSYWTIVGVSGDTKKSLINEQGLLEVDKQRFCLEPFLFVDGRLVTWSDVITKQYLADGYAPMPIVEWNYRNEWFLDIEPCAAGYPGKSLLGIRYSVTRTGGSGRGKLFVAIRPFQVVPPWQQLNMVGGVSRIDSIGYLQGNVVVDGMTVVPMTAPSGFGAVEFDQGSITDFLPQGVLPSGQKAADHFGRASAALEYDFDIPTGRTEEFVLAVPLHGWNRSPLPDMRPQDAGVYFDLMSRTQLGRWVNQLNALRLVLPGRAQDVANTVRSNLAYILATREGPALQPGSRTYERSWIRDGSLMCAALLRCGFTAEVRDFLDWYAGYQYPSGKIPCVVDARGADALPENDSHGEFIYAVLQYFRFTRDTVWLRSKFDNVVRAARYIQSLRAERKTDTYRNGPAEQRALYGLLPESISHEGYSDFPRHSYWDDFFALRGVKDAATIARVLGEEALALQFAADRDDFRTDLYASMRLAMRNKHINFIPGCAELGDFDATSTTIGIDPGGEVGYIPEPELHNTFDRYYGYFVRRKTDGSIRDYTPYETRIIGTMVMLGQKKRAEALLNYFMNDRRPAGWNGWAEVVWRDRDAPRYIGDMPHAWVGSDFIRSVLTMFLYEREKDNTVVLAAGIPDAWLEDSSGVSVTGLRTYEGTLDYTLRKKGNVVQATISGTVPVPGNRLVFSSPLSRKIRSIRIDGAPAAVPRSGEVVLPKLPLRIEFRY